MKELKELISCLNKAQYDVLYNFYQATPSDRNRKLELLSLLTSNKISNEDDVCYLLYQKKKSTAFTHLKSSLKEDLCKFILSHNHCSGGINSYEEADIECSQRILIAKILINNGIFNSAYKHLENAYKLAEQYELTLHKIQIATLLGRKRNTIHPLTLHRKYITIIHENISQLDKEVKAFDHFNSITLPHVYEKNKENKFSEEASQRINDLKILSAQNNSINIKFLYLKSAINYYLISQQYKLALKTTYECKEMIQTEDAVYSSARLSVIYCQIAQNQMELKNPDQAIEVIKEAFKVIDKKTLGYLLCQLTLFVAQLCKGQLSSAEQTIKLASKNKLIDTNRFYHYNIIYYKAILAFKQDNFLQAWKILNTNSKLQKDSTGWLLGFKLTELMLLIELKEEQIIPLRIDALKQLIYRQPLLKESRYKYILDLLKSLKANKYNFKLSAQKNSEILANLRSSKGLFYRDPVAFELIAFEDWFEENAKK